MIKNKKKILVLTLLTVIGVLGGWAYYRFVGCATGSCSLKSNPYAMMFLGGFIGYSLIDIPAIKKKFTSEEENSGNNPD